MRRVPRHDKGYTRTGWVAHAVERDPNGYSSRTLCGVSCAVIDLDGDEFHPLDADACQRCAAMEWRGRNSNGGR